VSCKSGILIFYVGRLSASSVVLENELLFELSVFEVHFCVWKIMICI